MKKKILSVLLIVALLMLTMTITNSVKATSDVATYGTVTVLTGSASNKSDDDNGVITIKYTKDEIKNLKWAESNPDIDRNVDGWWLGFSVKAPATADSEKSTWSDNTRNNVTFKSVLDDGSGDTCSYYVYIDPSVVEKHDSVWTYNTYTFDWKTAGDVEIGKLTVKLEIDPTEVEFSYEGESGVTPVKVTIDEHEFALKSGKSLKDISELEKLKTKEGYKFVGFYTTIDGKEVEVKEDEAITADTVLTAKFEKVEEEKAPEASKEEQKEEQKDDTPATGSINFEIVASAIVVISLAGIIIIKKYNK